MQAPSPGLFGVQSASAAGPNRAHSGLALADQLRSLGFTTAFTLPGGHIAPILDGLAEVGVRLISARHEGAAAQMAQGWALTTGAPGLAVVTAGAGFTNAVTALADCHLGGVPLMMVGGRTRRSRQGRGAVQDIEQARIASAFTKISWVLGPDLSQALVQLAQARQLTTSCPSGPAYLDLPADLGFSPLPDNLNLAAPRPAEPPAPAHADVEALMAALATSQRPLILAGSGAFWSAAGQDLLALAQASAIPITTTSAARGLISDDHPCCLGTLVHGGFAMQMADTVMVIGSRFNGNLLYGGPPLFPEGMRVLQVDADPLAQGLNRAADIFCHGDAKLTLAALAEAWPASKRFDDWLGQARAAIATSQQMWRTEMETSSRLDAGLHPAQLALAVERALAGQDRTVISDGGDVLAWSLAFLSAPSPGSLLTTSTSLGTLGLGLPFAIAAAAAHPHRRTVLITGDGALGLAAMEIETAVRSGLSLVVLVSNNSSWGDVRNEQGRWFGEDRHAASVLGDVRYDRLAEALGAGGMRVTQEAQLEGCLQAALAGGGVWVIDVPTDWQIHSQLLEAIGQLGVM